MNDTGETAPDPTEIQRLAALGEAPNQCPECKAYRLDGRPPHLHQRGCSLTESIEDSVDRWVREQRQS